MSEIVGFINLDGEPARQDVLEEMAASLRRRAPDGTAYCYRGATGLAHALLRLSPEGKAPPQPYSADGRVWITADCHLYGRAELEESLQRVGSRMAASASDEDLVLEAYRAFGDDFAARLLGDFAIAIWDEPRQRLVLARDHLGVRPFFYARTDKVVAFGTNLDSLLRHPAVGSALDEKFVADFLVFGTASDGQSSVYRQIRRLPAAHTLTFDRSGLRLDRYWSPSRPRLSRPKDEAEYVEEFAGLFERAVESRLPPGNVAIELSGGLDSGAVAAVAAAHADSRSCKVMGYTNSCVELLPEDEEAQFAAQTATYLGISQKILSAEDYPLFAGADDPDMRTSEPFGTPDLGQARDTVRIMLASGSRILLTGQLGDTNFAGSRDYYLRLALTGRWPRLISELRAYRMRYDTLAGTGIRSQLRLRVRKLAGKRAGSPEFPGWLNPDFVVGTGIEERWKSFWAQWATLTDLCGHLQRPWLSSLFESYEALDAPVQARHPFADVRLLEFMMEVPNLYGTGKRLLRNALAGRLPETVLWRPKRALPGDILMAKMRTGLVAELPPLERIARYVDVDLYRRGRATLLLGGETHTTWPSWYVNYPIALAHWMNHNEPHEP